MPLHGVQNRKRADLPDPTEIARRAAAISGLILKLLGVEGRRLVGIRHEDYVLESWYCQSR